MEKTKNYDHVHFSAEVLKEAHQAFLDQVDSEKKQEFYHRLTVAVDDARWSHDTMEEFIADYRKGQGSVYFVVKKMERPFSALSVTVYGSGNDRDTHVEVRAPNRSKIEAVFEAFEKHVGNSRLPTDPPKPPQTKPTIFIGHGRSLLWRELKDHLKISMITKLKPMKSVLVPDTGYEIFLRRCSTRVHLRFS